MVLKKVHPHVCAVQNESVGCFSEENVNYIKENSKRQILSFDSDKPGVKNSQEITKLFGFEYLNVPRPYLSDGITDFADLAKDYGLKKVEQILKRKKKIFLLCLTLAPFNALLKYTSKKCRNLIFGLGGNELVGK